VHYATGKFLDAVVKVPNWQNDSLATVVQSVQFSADGTAYAKHEQQAQQIADVLVGNNPAGVTCTFSKPTVVASGAVVASALTTDLPVARPSTSGRTVTVSGAGWATSAWLVCNANRLGIDSVAYSGKRWTRAHGWAAYTAAGSSTVTAVLATT
jgi:hypothetical protein